MDDDLHLPWNRNELKQLLLKIISTGETNKVDFKSFFNLTDIAHQAELLKDISALANTYCHYYRNHGFIIFGVTNNVVSFSSFPQNEDHLQATIDDLVKKYLGPFITTNLFIFDDASGQWGVLVIPPTANAPHVFYNDIHKRYRGDVYVRNGTITEKAQPEDYARFFRQHLEEHTYDIKRNILDLQRQAAGLDEQLKKVRSRTVNKKTTVVTPETSEKVANFSALTLPVSEVINNALIKEEDVISRGLFNEARKVISFLESDEIPWVISSTDKKMSEEILSKIESISNELWISTISIMLKDEKGIYSEALLKTISYLSKQIEAPSGTSYTALGKNIRYYPLFILLYLVSIIGVAKKRDKLLKKIFKIELQGKTFYDEPLPISIVLFFIRRADDIFHPLYNNFPSQRWCDPVASCAKILIDKILCPDDPFWIKDREFFNGEFVLCLTPLDAIDKETSRPLVGQPSSGLYVFISSSVPIITRFLKNEKDWIREVFERPLDELLKEFDQTAKDLGRPSGCWGDGFLHGALEVAFPEKKEITKS